MKKSYVLFVLVLLTLPFVCLAGTNKKNARNMRHIIPADSSECYAGQQATVCGKVYGYYYNPKINGAPTFLDIGATYPNAPFTVLVGDSSYPRFNFPLDDLVNNDVCFTGVVTVYNNISEMIITDPMQISVDPKAMKSSLANK